MTKEECNDGKLRLGAHPLSHVCYHVRGDNSITDNVLLVYSYGDRPNSSIRVPQNNEKVGKQNKVAPVDSNKGKMGSARKLKDVKEAHSKSRVTMNNMYECLAGDGEE